MRALRGRISGSRKPHIRFTKRGSACFLVFRLSSGSQNGGQCFGIRIPIHFAAFRGGACATWFHFCEPHLEHTWGREALFRPGLEGGATGHRRRQAPASPDGAARTSAPGISIPTRILPISCGLLFAWHLITICAAKRVPKAFFAHFAGRNYEEKRNRKFWGATPAWATVRGPCRPFITRA